MQLTTRKVLMGGHVWSAIGVVVPPSQREKAVAVMRRLFSEGHPVRELAERLARQKPWDPRELWRAERDTWPRGLSDENVALACAALEQEGFTIARAELVE